MPPPWKRKRSCREARKAREGFERRRAGLRSHDWQLDGATWWCPKCKTEARRPSTKTCADGVTSSVMET